MEQKVGTPGRLDSADITFWPLAEQHVALWS